jgi:hypothetical protein
MVLNVEGEQTVSALPNPMPAAFRYLLPPAPVASAAVDIGHVAVTIELFLTGDLAVTTDDAPADQTRVGALTTLRAMTKGLMIRGLGSPTPSISSTARHQFVQRRHDFREPNTITFTGECTIDVAHRCDGMDVTVAGEVGYSLEVTALPTAGGLPRPTDAATGRGWFVHHDKELASIGMVVLVAAPIAPARLTGMP